MRLFPLLAPLLALLAACARPAQLPPTPAPPAQVAVIVDSRIELMSAVQLLAGYFLVSPYDSAYEAEMRAHFAPHVRHPAVTLFRQMSKEGFAFSNVPDTLMRYTPPPALAPRIAVTERLTAAAGGQARLDAFMEALRDFARASDFALFFAAHRPFYEGLAERSRAAATAPVAALQAYTGMPVRGATVVLGPLLHDGGFAVFYDLPGGGSEAFALVGPTKPVEWTIHFGDAERLEDLVAHEFGHLIVNPLGDAHAAAIEARAAAFPPIAEAMRRNGYSNWKTSVDEHVIRAVTARIAARARGEEAGAAAVAEEVERGFVHVPALAERLKRYEARRGNYPTLADFSPELLAAFPAG